MYNESRKTEYINEAKSRNLYLKESISWEFRDLEQTEKDLGKDCCDFTAPEIISYYKGIGTKSFDYLIMLNNRLTGYTNWCLSNNLVKDNQNHYMEMDAQIINMCVNQGLRNENIIKNENLLKEICLFNNPSDQFICLGLFEGMDTWDFYQLSYKDIANGYLSKNGRNIRLSEKLISLGEESANEYNYYAFTNVESRAILKYRLDDPYIVKDMYNANTNSKTKNARKIWLRLTRLQNIVEQPNAFMSKALMESGRIDFIKGLMQKKGLDLKSTIKEYSNEITERYGAIYAVQYYEIKYGVYFE